MTAQLTARPRLAALVVTEAWRRMRGQLRTPTLATWLMRAGHAQALAALPRPLMRGDVATAAEIYAGRFRFAGRLVETRGRSPFQIIPPSREWCAALHSFAWLGHLNEAGDALSAANARVLVSDWLAATGPASGSIVQDPEIAATRVTAWLSAAGLLLEGADAAFERRFLRGLAHQIRHLRYAAPDVADGLPRLRVRIALALAALCLPNAAMPLRHVTRQLADELTSQVFADGVHVSRDPAAGAEILAELLPLREAYAAAGQPLDRGVFGAIDRMLPTLRFFRHGDGTLALFNGAGALRPGLLAALLRHDETLGEPISQARQGGYQRLSAAGTVLLTDAGLPAPGPVSGRAHAGTLAFELSSGPARLVVNCGAPPAGAAEEWRALARATAAHSTLTLDDHSSSRFDGGSLARRFLGTPVIGGPEHVPVGREDESDGQRLSAAHDGYRARFGLVHERSLFLSRTGHYLEGVDRLSGTPRAEPLAAVVRFHLHPDVCVEEHGEDLLLSAGGQRWIFAADVRAVLEESVFFAALPAPARTLQIALPFEANARREIAWTFRRI